MATAPYCNVSIARPGGDPKKPGGGIQQIPPGATLQQITNIVNNNFRNMQGGHYTEDRSLRQTTITRIFDPSDSSVYVDVEQITGMFFVNDLTGQIMSWRQ